jgi:arabinogalactan oligomer/maltooligosaccharide transport system permease protein
MRRVQSLWPHLVLIPVTAAVLYPVLWVVKMALSPGQSFDTSLSPIPPEVSLEHFRVLLGPEGRFLRQAANSLIVAGATTVVGIAVSCTAAYAFSRMRFPGRDALLGSFLLTQIFPGVVMTVPLYILLDSAGLLNSLTGLVLVYASTAVPFCTWMLKGYFDTLPKEMEEAAQIDGASQLDIFLKLVLPLSRPAIAVTALFSFMTAWNEFILAATFLADESMFTLPVALQRHVGEFRTDWGLFAAGALLASSVVMAVFFALQKHLVGGLTAGSVKG